MILGELGEQLASRIETLVVRPTNSLIRLPSRNQPSTYSRACNEIDRHEQELDVSNQDSVQRAREQFVSRSIRSIRCSCLTIGDRLKPFRGCRNQALGAPLSHQQRRRGAGYALE